MTPPPKKKHKKTHEQFPYAYACSHFLWKGVLYGSLTGKEGVFGKIYFQDIKNRKIVFPRWGGGAGDRESACVPINLGNGVHSQEGFEEIKKLLKLFWMRRWQGQNKFTTA